MFWYKIEKSLLGGWNTTIYQGGEKLTKEFDFDSAKAAHDFGFCFIWHSF